MAQTAEIQLAEVTAENLRKQKEDQELTVSAEIERELEAEEQKLEATAPWGEENENVDKDSSEPAMRRELLREETKSLEQSEQVTKEQQSQPRGPEDTARLAELDREENEELADTNIWKKMSDLYTKVLAFDYDNGCEILSIKPQDIGLLPREVWTYGNNSFLLHGYYNYRHLIGKASGAAAAAQVSSWCARPLFQQRGSSGVHVWLSSFCAGQETTAGRWAFWILVYGYPAVRE